MKRNGSYVVEDLGSYNGVTVNGERIDARSDLAAGDQLGIGDYDLAFQSDVVVTANTLPSPKPKSQPPPRLVVLTEPALGAEFTLGKSALRIGRDERLDIWINHKSISHEHAEVQVEGGRVTVFDLESANGMRVNGVSATRAILESGDVLELGEVRFRFVPPQGAHSLEPLPHEEARSPRQSESRKPIFAALVIGLLLLAAAGAVLVTMRGAPTTAAVQSRGSIALPSPLAQPTAVELRSSALASDRNATEQESSRGGDSEGRSIEAPREWEGQLALAHEALAEGLLDRAFSIANELPEDSILRQTPEFGEICYRYAQAHINEGERALGEGDAELARGEASLVLELSGITAKQRQDAKRLLRRAGDPDPRSAVRANVDP